jgi:hypothetical protein
LSFDPVDAAILQIFQIVCSLVGNVLCLQDTSVFGGYIASLIHHGILKTQISCTWKSQNRRIGRHSNLKFGEFGEKEARN